MGKIGEKLIEESGNTFTNALRFYQAELNEAYLKAEKALDVTLKLTLEPEKNGSGIKPTLNINFITDRCKGSFSGRPVDESQMVLFSTNGKPKNPAPAATRGYHYGGRLLFRGTKK